MNGLLANLLRIGAIEVGAQVQTPDRWIGEVVEVNHHPAGLLLHVRSGGRDMWYWACECRRV